MAGNQDDARRNADEVVKAAQGELDKFSHKQYQVGDGPLQAEAERRLKAAKDARANLG